MIFVTVGTNEAPFDRLVRAVERFPEGEGLVVQHGSSPVRPANATCLDYVSFDVLVDHIRRARAVVTHAGIGSMIVALANGKRPIVVPRLQRFGEAVDDHQVPLAHRLAERGAIQLVETIDLLPEALAEAAPSSVEVGADGRLSRDLRAHLESLVRSRG
jgi:UDP-N-acetylglucosamine transferase subunit ALG13